MKIIQDEKNKSRDSALVNRTEKQKNIMFVEQINVLICRNIF